MAKTSDLLKQTEGWVKEIYSNFDHLARTVHWVKRLAPGASEALILAALTHDIERAFPKGRRPPSPDVGEVKWDDVTYQRWHQDRSAKFASNFLKKQKADPKLIKKVADLVRKHEEGGNEEANLLRDADSLSFLEVNSPLFLSWVPTKLSKEAVKGKLDYMFKRIEGGRAKVMAQKFYNKALLELHRTKC